MASDMFFFLSTKNAENQRPTGTLCISAIGFYISYMQHGEEKILASWKSKRTPPKMPPKPPQNQGLSKAFLLGDDVGESFPLIRPAISWG